MNQISLAFTPRKTVLLRFVLLTAICLLAVSASASTTISTDINTEGTLTVTGISNLKDKIYNSFGALMLDQAGQTNTNIVLNPTSGNVGVGTSTPWGKFSINPNGITGPSFAIGSSTATSFVVTNGGNVGIGTTSPIYPLHVSGGKAGGTGVINSFFNNPNDTDMWIKLQSGLTTDTRNYFAWYNYSGSDHQWLMGKNAADFFILFDATTQVHRMVMEPIISGGTGVTDISSIGTAPVTINSPRLDTSANRGTGGLSVYSGGASSEAILKVESDSVKIIDKTPYATGVGGTLSLQGYYNSSSQLRFAEIKAVKETATSDDPAAALVFKTLKTGLGGVPAEYMRISSVGKVGIGTTSPQQLLHVSGSAPKIWLDNTATADSALARTITGIEISSSGMNNTSKYTPAIKFMTTDSSFTTENPKLLALIVGRATQPYDVNTAGGMALDFATTPNSPGATNIPLVRLTIGESGNVGIGTTTPSQSLDVNGTINIEGSTNGIIMHDTATASCYLIQVTNGALALTAHACQ